MKNLDESNGKKWWNIKAILNINKMREKGVFRSKFVVIVSVLSLTLLQAWSQTTYAVHANIIYHFTKYINWPNEKKAGDFVIGIIGDTPLYDELKNFTSNKTAAGQRIIIKRFPASAASYNCHILFVSDEESGNVKRIAAATAGTPTLLVTESEGVTRKGSCINFIIVDDHLKLEINKTNIERRGLDIATELLSLGIIVK